MKLVERHIIHKSDKRYAELDDILYKCKNLYNTGLYHVRQHFFMEKEEHKYLNYYELDKKLRSENNCDYRALPTSVSQQVLMLVDHNFKSFFKLLRKKKEGKYTEKIHVPKYLDKQGRFIAIFTTTSLSTKREKGIIKLPKQYTFTATTKQNNIQQVRFVPKANHIVMEVVYNRQEKEMMPDNGRYMGIDLGINNLSTCATNTGIAFIINGKPVKAINQYYNKRIAYLRSRIKTGLSKRIKRTTEKRNRRISDYIHKASRIIINHAVSNNINTIVIGYNKGWKQEVNIGKVNNQKFVAIPFKQLIEMIRYKAQLKGINVIITEESYTSKCSFIDKEKICKHREYIGERTKRGMFVSPQWEINADVNAALNIIRKKVSDEAVYTLIGRGKWQFPTRINCA